MNGHKIINQNSTHFITCTVVGWIDVFTRDIYKEIIVETLNYCMQSKGLELNAFVIMTNHIHLICRAKHGYKLSNILRDFKSYTSKKIVETIKTNHKESRREWMMRLFKYYAKFNKNNSKYQLWQRSNKPIELISHRWTFARLKYIHNNPVNAGIVAKSEDYIYSSASNYYNGIGVIECSIIDLGSGIGYLNL